MSRGPGRAVLLDTHAWVWSFAEPARLSARAREAIETAEAVQVSSITFFEIGQKVRVGKWPEMASLAPGLDDLLVRQGGVAAPFTPAICLGAALMAWDHRDPFDRLIAATADSLGLPLVTCDAAFGALRNLHVVW